ncbi:TetR/AcrR family transcriptional regulator [Paenibacillus sp. IITD108]|uniref:TetR/AcrR family transcriptional regulator n=1 Tax=Paenibacillus sp. IITD108 TaxID=3116649 RepID=UPI002F41B0A2
MPKIIVTENQWVMLGIERFSQGGAEALIIESMASALSCSKSSFYWYFSNRSSFIRRIVNQWVHLSTQLVMAASSEPVATEEKLNKLLHQMFFATRKGDFLFYLRKLCTQEPEYREVLDGMEQGRMSFARDLLLNLGMTTEAAEHKAWFLYHYYLGWYERHKLEQPTEKELLDHVRLIREHLI